jgi:hypothetical protein
MASTDRIQQLTEAMAEIAMLERRIALESATAHALREELDAQSDAERQVAALVGEIDFVRDTVAHRDIEIHSLRTSLELALGQCEAVSLRPSGDDTMPARIEFLESALAAAENECARLSDESRANNERHRLESDGLNAMFADMTSRALAAESQLKEVLRSLQKTADNRRAIDDASEKERKNWAELARALARLVMIKRQSTEPDRTPSASTLLVNTVAF